MTGDDGTPKKDKFLKALEEHSVYKAAQMAGVGRTTVFRWRDADPEFAEAWAAAVEAKTDHVEDKLMELINGGNVVATIFYLKTQGKKRGYVERQDVGIDTNPADPFDWATAIGAAATGSMVDPARSRADQGANGRETVGQNGNGRGH